MKRRIVSAIIFISILTIVNCSGSKIRTDPGKEFIFYPPLPTTPRYQYLTTFSTSDDVKKKKSGFLKFVAGSKQEKPEIIVKPYGIAIFEGVIYVCDSRSHTIVTLDLKKKEFGYLGNKGAGKLKRPINIKIDENERIFYVTDMGRNQVLSYDLNGKFIKAFGKNRELSPSGLELTENRLFVSDISKNQIVVMDKKSGEILYRIGEEGHGEGELYHPTNIAIHEQKLYVSDMTNFRISIFDLKGNFIDTFGKVGLKPGDFARPKGIAVDKTGRIYVVDSAFQNVQVFNEKFQLLLFMFGKGGERHNINLPAVVVIDYNNLEYFRKYISPDFNAEYLLFVTSNFGRSKLNVYAFGTYDKK